MQENAAIISGSAPSQSFKLELKVTPSAYLIYMEYDVITEPLLTGANQVIVTPVFETTEVVGAFGWFGTAAAITDSTAEFTENPLKLLD